MIGSWFFLILAGIFEIGFATTLKMTDGFTKIAPTVIFLLFSILSFWSLNKAIETIPIGIAYAVWTGIGAAGTVCMGALLFGEVLGMWKILFIATLIASIFGLKLIN